MAFVSLLTSGAASFVHSPSQNARRIKQGNVMLADAGEHGIVEILGRSDKTFTVLKKDGTTAEVPHATIKTDDIHTVPYKEFKAYAKAEKNNLAEFENLLAGEKRIIADNFKAASEEYKAAFGIEANEEAVLNLSKEEQTEFLNAALADKKITERQKSAYVNYVMRGNAYRAMNEAHNAKVENAVEGAVARIRKNVNPDMGGILTVEIDGTEYVTTKGGIARNEDGTIDKNNSSKEIYYRDKNGQKQIVPLDKVKIKQFIPESDAFDLAERIASGPVTAREQNDLTRPYEAGELVRTESGMFGVIKSEGLNEDGTYTLAFETPQGIRELNIEPRQIVNEDNIRGMEQGDTVDYLLDGKVTSGEIEDIYSLRNQGIIVIDGKEIPVADIIKKDAKTSIDELNQKLSDTDKAVQSESLTEEQKNYLREERDKISREIERLENERQETAPAETETEKPAPPENIRTETAEDTKPSPAVIDFTEENPPDKIPKDDKGNLLFEQAPKETTLAALKGIFDNESEVRSTVEATIGAKQKALEKAAGYKPSGDIQKDMANKLKSKEEAARIQKELDYWNGVLASMPPTKESVTKQLTGKDVLPKTDRRGEQPARAEDNGHGLTEAREAGEKYVNEQRVSYDAETSRDLEVVNKRFNDELRQQIDGTQPKGHVYKLGIPGSILQSTGFPNLPIELNADILLRKATVYGHNFDLSEIENLPNAIQNPIAVFSYGDKTKAQNVLIEAENKDGKKFLVGISLNPKISGKNIEVNSVRNVFPKDTNEWVNWINQGKGLYFDKEKVLNFLDQQRINPADVAFGLPENQVQQENSKLSESASESATKIIENFENPKLPDGKLQNTGDAFIPVTEKESNALIDVLKKTGLAKDVIADVDKMREVLGKEGVKAFQEIAELSEVNAAWNKALDDFKAGKLKPHEILSLGKPLAILNATGLKSGQITVTQRVLNDHLKQHGLTTDDIKNLAEAIQNPIMVYEWGTKAKSTVIITELTTKDGRKITVAVRAENKNGNLEVSEVASIHGKAAERFLSEMENAKEGGLTSALRYVDKEKALDWLGTAPPKGATQTNQGLNSTANVIENFENPKVSDGNLHLPDNVRPMATSKGEVYGFVTEDGTVYIDPNRLNANTPIHEFGHLFWSTMPEAVRTEITGLLKQTPAWEKLSDNSAYSNLKTDDQKADEIFNTILGNRGEKSIPAEEIMGRDITLIARITNAVNKFWEWVKSVFGSKEAKINRMADMTLGELLGGKKINLENEGKNINFAEQKNNMSYDKRTISESTLQKLVGRPEERRGIYRTVEAGNSAGSVRAVLEAEELEELESRGINPFWDTKKFKNELRKLAQGNGVWLEKSYLDDKTLLHNQKAIGTSEHDVYLNSDGKTLTKLNNLAYATDSEHNNNLSALIDRFAAHNDLFPNVSYTIKGFMDNLHGNPALVLEQPFIDAERNATREEIHEYLKSHGFKLDGKRSWANLHEVWSNGKYELFDARPANVLKGKDGNLYFFDTIPHSADYISLEEENLAARFQTAPNNPVPSTEQLRADLNEKLDGARKETK